MKIIYCTDTQQDTLQVKNLFFKDSIGLKTDSVSINKPLPSNDSVNYKTEATPKTDGIYFAGNSAVCVRNSIADITYFDSNNLVIWGVLEASNKFPFILTEKNKQMQARARVSLEKHLKPGKDIPVQPLHDDWVIIIILIAAFLYSLSRTSSKRMLTGVSRLFLFRGIKDSSSRENAGIFHWQSTILNLFSFLIIGLFVYFAASYYDLIPSGISGINFWLISVGIIIAAVTIRHFFCIITGYASNQKEVFMEYLLGVYLSYRFSALLLFLLIILISYTLLLPVRVYFISGIIIIGISYLIRITRLLIIFINRNISIFYLILYLCALEILPVLISVKYFTGLI